MERHHLLILLVYLLPLGYLLYCLKFAPDVAVNSEIFKSKNNNTPDEDRCDVSGFNKRDSASICHYIRNNCDLEMFRISQAYYCDEDWEIRVALGLSITAGLVVIFMIFGLITSNFLYPNLDLLSKHVKISNRISGLTLLALGNATPDIFSTYNAFKSNSSSLAIGELLGSANFVICFVIGSMGILKPFQVNQFEFIKDLFFFIVLISISLYFIHDEKLMNSECIFMILLYLAYVNYSIFFTNEGKEPEELMPVPTNHIDEEAQGDHLSPDMYSQIHENYEGSIRSSLDDNKAKGFQKLSFYDAMKLWRIKSPNFQSRPANSTRVRSTENFRDLNPPSPISPSVFGRSASSDAVIRNTNETEPLIRHTLHAPSPIQPPSILLEEDEIESEEQLSPHFEEKRNSLWNFLFNPLTDETDSYSFLTIVTFPLLFLLNILIPVFSKELVEEELKYHKSVQFKKKLFFVQLFIIPFFFKALLFEDAPLYISLLVSLILLTADIILRNFHKYTIPLIGFISSILLIITTSSYLITFLKNIGVIFRISESLLGLTILALGNSTGDLISNLTLAELDLSVIGINACFGSPLLYILIGIGINGMIINIKDSKEYMKLTIDTNFKMSSLGLILMLFFYGVAIPLNGWFIDRKIGMIGVLWWCIITGINVYLENN